MIRNSVFGRPKETPRPPGSRYVAHSPTRWFQQGWLTLGLRFAKLGALFRARGFVSGILFRMDLKKVERETGVAASHGVRGTPSFFVNNRLLVGSQPFELFRTVVEEEFKAKSVRGKTE